MSALLGLKMISQLVYFLGKCCRMGIKKGAVAVSLVLLSLVSLVNASEQYVVFSEELEPVHYTENGKMTGIATEVVRAIFSEANLSADIQSYPWKRSYRNVLKKKDSFIFTINRTPAREELFQWIGPILPKKTCLFRLKSREDIQVNKIEDLANYTTAVILGYALTEKLQEQGFSDGEELIVAPEKKAQLKLFLAGRADLITGNEYTIAAALKSVGRSIHDVEQVLVITEKGYYLAANIDTDPSLVQRLRQANQVVQQSNRVEEIINTYMQ